MFFLTTDR